MSTIDQKTGIPLGWAATIVSTIAVVVFHAGVAHVRLQALQKTLQQYRDQRRISDQVARQQQLKLQRLDMSLTNIEKSIQSIDRKLDRLQKTDRSEKGNGR